MTMQTHQPLGDRPSRVRERSPIAVVRNRQLLADRRVPQWFASSEADRLTASFGPKREIGRLGNPLRLAPPHHIFRQLESCGEKCRALADRGRPRQRTPADVEEAASFYADISGRAQSLSDLHADINASAEVCEV